MNENLIHATKKNLEDMLSEISQTKGQILYNCAYTLPKVVKYAEIESRIVVIRE